jgi:hypothetical protein
MLEEKLFTIKIVAHYKHDIFLSPGSKVNNFTERTE